MGAGAGRQIDLSRFRLAGARDVVTSVVARLTAWSDRPLSATHAGFALVAGILLARVQPEPIVWQWLAGASVLWLCAVCMFLFARHETMRVALTPLVVLVIIMLGGAWYTVRMHHVAPNDLACYVSDKPILVRVRGTALKGPEVRRRTAGSMAEYDYRRPATYFPMRVEQLIGRDGTTVNVQSDVLVRVDRTVRPFRAGQRFETTGFLNQPGPPDNPGEYDYRTLALALGQAGFLTVRDRGALVRLETQRNQLVETWNAWRDALRNRASGLLLSHLPDTPRAERDALLNAIILGERDRELDQLAESFRLVGLGHILAISGLHIGILAGFVLLVLTRGGPIRRAHGVALIAVVLMFLVLVEVRMPVLRAGVMTIAASLGFVLSRHLHIGRLIALAGVLLLIWRPHELFSAGFQLSFAVVLGLTYCAGRVRQRWFGRAERNAGATSAMIAETLKSWLAVAFTAWLIATPLALYHFGVFSPLAPFLSVMVLPIVAALVVAGFLKLVLALVLPSAGLLVGLPLALTAEMMVLIVELTNTLPGSALHFTPPGARWTLAALALSALWAVGWCQQHKRLTTAWLVALGVLLIWPVQNWRVQPVLRIDMLSVGDGSCYVFRSAGQCVIFDAGSSTNLDAGRREIVPAMRALGIHDVHAIVLSHANLDHYSAVLEVVDAMDTPCVFITPQFERHVRAEPFGAPAHLLDQLIQRRVAVESVSAGAQRTFGEMTWNWLHPAASAQYDRANDHSTVIRIECAERSVLLTGDVQEDAINDLLADEHILACDIIELPHHGSFNEPAVQLIKRASPELIMQSTGRWRWRRDRWAHVLEDARRLVTARDGACWIEIDHDGNITTGRFLITQ